MEVKNALAVEVKAAGLGVISYTVTLPDGTKVRVATLQDRTTAQATYTLKHEEDK